jgi:hypothetical protein
LVFNVVLKRTGKVKYVLEAAVRRKGGARKKVGKAKRKKKNRVVEIKAVENEKGKEEEKGNVDYLYLAERWISCILGLS